MKLTEFQILMPMTVDEFLVAHLYTVVKYSKENTGGGAGIEWIKNEPYDNTDGHMGTSELTQTKIPLTKGQYTLKKYHVAKKAPRWMQALLPAKAMILVEEAWNGYPHCLTVIESTWLSRAKFRISVESLHVAGRFTLKNALGLGADDLAARTVIQMDPGVYPFKDKPKCEPWAFKAANGRGPLTHGWWDRADVPVITVYKSCKVHCGIMFLGGFVQNFFARNNYKMFWQVYADMVVGMDEWFGMDIDDIRRLENKGMEELDAERDKGEIKTNYAMDDRKSSGRTSFDGGTECAAAAAVAAAVADVEASKAGGGGGGDDGDDGGGGDS